MERSLRLRGRARERPRPERGHGLLRREARAERHRDLLVAGEVVLAGGTGGQMGLELLRLVRIQRIQRVGGGRLGEGIVRAHTVNAADRVAMALRILVFTVPSGTPVRAAISDCVRPS